MDNTYQLDWNPMLRPAPEWFRDAKFGLFFHWGPYSVPAYMNEWYSRNMYCKGLEQNRWHEEHYGSLHDFGYKDFIPMMSDAGFDPEAWAALAELSGARYAGPVSEHSDNFSMWNSKVNPVNSFAMGPHRDVVGECFQAFRRHGIRTLATFHHQWLWGWFMSTDNEADVYDPANEKFYGPALPLETNRYIPYRMPDEAFNRTWAAKVQEVIDQYQPDVVYFDSRTCIIDEAFRHRVADYFYHKSGCSDGILTYKQEDFPQGVGVYDIECGRFSTPKCFPWQSDDRLEDNITWCIVQEPKYKSSTRIIHQLCDIVSKNGNLLLNVGPQADGSFHPNAIRELTAVGNWLRQNGEAIYGSRPFVVAAEGPTTVEDANYDVDKINDQLEKGAAGDVHCALLTEQDFRFTTNHGFLYCIAMGWPKDGVLRCRTLRLSGAAGRIVSVSLLIGNTAQVSSPAASASADSLPVTFEQTADALQLQLPEQKPCESAYVFRIQAEQVHSL